MPNNPDQQPDPVEKSLGDQATGADVSRTDEERSLGDQSTTGDALSSLSDLGSDLGEAIDSDLPLIDLAARYEIEGELGQGGMGAVLLATDRQLKRKVAIKRILGSMSKSKTALQRFVTEAQSIAKLNHFNIVQVYEFGRDAEGPFLVLEYVGGGSLLDKLKDGKLEIEEAVDITCQLCDGLAVAHEQGIVHRDIKPANILLTKRGEPKLTDFGLARQESLDHGQTQAGALLGTIDFMPPEQRRDATAADARSDLWSLAATTYQMITGKSPKVIRLDQLPGNLAPVIGKMLEDNPDERYATAEEFKAELRKGMATVATTVAADLAAGVCPACNTANDASRKFCRGCRAPLVEPCLSCETDNPVWEDVCGNCGSSQQEERELVRSKLSDTLEVSLTLAREHEYKQSLAQLKLVNEDQHAFTEDIRQRAAKQIEAITTQRDEQHQLRDQLVALAAKHQQAHDYGAVVRELEKIPEPLRTGNKVAVQLSNARCDHDELSSLEKQIRDDVKNKRVDGLLEKATRFLELKPGHAKIHELHEQLQQRQQKVNLRELKTRIAAETSPAVKLPLVEQYLELRPDDQQAEQLAEGLRKQMQAAALQEEQAVKQRKQRKQLIIASSVLVASVLVLVAGLTIQSRFKEQQAVAAAEKAAAEKSTAISAALKKKNWPRVLHLDPTNSEALKMKAAAETMAAEKAAAKQAAAEKAAAEKAAAEELAAEELAAEKAAAEKAAAKLATSIEAALAIGDWETVLRLDPFNSKALELKADAPITNTLDMTFNKLSAGTFTMGSPENEPGRSGDETQHRVTIIKAFYMQTTEVTQGQWTAMIGTEPWKGFKGYVKEGAHYPATYVSWDDAILFCKTLSEKEGKSYRLPTEAEWEYACRSGTKTTWSFGDDEKALGDYAWYEKNAYNAGQKYAHRVGLKKPNAFGMYDMHGNVNEWCHDYYEEDYYKQSRETDPTGPAFGLSRVLRGGSWHVNLVLPRSAHRHGTDAGSRYYDLGFRLVRELD